MNKQDLLNRVRTEIEYIASKADSRNAPNTTNALMEQGISVIRQAIDDYEAVLTRCGECGGQHLMGECLTAER